MKKYRSVMSQSSDSNEQIARREQAIRDEGVRRIALKTEVARERFLRIQDWLRVNRPDIAPGSPMLSGLIAEDDSLSLPELEGYGAYGNAVQVAMDGLGNVGQLWWCEPEARVSPLQRFAFYTEVESSFFQFSLVYAPALEAI